MALVLKDRVRQVTTTTGTGTITLSGSVNGFQAFADVLSDADTTYYVINDSTSGDFEVGLGTFTASGTTLSRDTILESSNSGSAVNFGAGQKEVFITYPAEKAVFQDGSDNVTLPADLTVDTDTLYVDSSNDRVGIGASSPAGKLHVKVADSGGIGTIKVDADDFIVEGSGNTGATMLCTRGDYAGWRVADSVDQMAIYDATADVSTGDVTARLLSRGDLIVGTGGGYSTRIFIDSGGKVGIGTSTPAGKLHTQLGTSFSWGGGWNSGTAVFGGAGTLDGAIAISYNDTDGGQIGAIIPGVSWKPVTFNSNELIFNTAGTIEAMRIDSSGNVGIGTTNPLSALDVRGPDDDSVSLLTNGSLQVWNSAQSTRAYAFASVSNGQSMFGGNMRLDDSVVSGSHIGYASGTDLRGGSGVVFDNTTAGSSSYGEIFFVQSNDTNDDTWVVREAMRIDSDGNVGIGTTTPSEKLEVAGNILLEDSELIFNSDAGAIAKIDNNSGDLRLHADASVLFFETDADVVKARIDTNFGRMRLGDDAVPSEALEVVGNVVPSADATHDLGTPSLSWNNIYTNDLHLSNMKHDKGNDIDGTKGTWTIQEGEDDLFIINNRNGKKYKFALEEIE